MADDAGFAVAITIRERLLKDALVVAYSNGDLGHKLSESLLFGPPEVKLDVFLAPPEVSCKANNSVMITVRMRGGMTITLASAEESADIAAVLTLRLHPAFVVDGSDLVLTIPDIETDLVATAWDFTVVSGAAFSPEADGYLRSASFRDRLRSNFGLAILAGKLSLPRIDISFLGRVLTAVDQMTAATRVVDSALLLGLDVATDDVTTAGSLSLLADFARGNDVAAVTSRVAVPILLGEVESEVKEAVENEGATLVGPLSLTPELGRFHVAGQVSKHSGSANFSFNLIPTMFAHRAGKTFQYLHRPVHVNTRVWPALGFATADIHVDVDPAIWVYIVTVIGTALNLGVPLIVCDMVSSTANQFRTKIAGGDTGAPVPRVQHRKPKRPGGAGVRIAIEEYNISPAGTYIGLTARPQALPGALIGPAEIPSDFRNHELGYTVRLPLATVLDDPDLRIRWTVIGPTGTVLVAEDGAAAGRNTFTFVPNAVAPAESKMVVGVRVYRALGAEITDLLNDSITLEIRGPLAPGAYIRWTYSVLNPQVEFNDATASWEYAGELTVNRHSNWHRTDRPCANVANRSRYSGNPEVRDALPFPLATIAFHRSELCDYCFYGGPAGLRASL